MILCLKSLHVCFGRWLAMTNKFDAVKESRKWKEMVAAQTNGLATEEVIKYFDRQAVNERFQAALKRAKAEK